jgi:hypothetical protein
MMPFSSDPHRGWPNPVRHLWFSTADHGVADPVYAPSEVRAKVAGGSPRDSYRGVPFILLTKRSGLPFLFPTGKDRRRRFFPSTSAYRPGAGRLRCG